MSDGCVKYCKKCSILTLQLIYFGNHNTLLYQNISANLQKKALLPNLMMLSSKISIKPLHHIFFHETRMKIFQIIYMYRF